MKSSHLFVHELWVLILVLVHEDEAEVAREDETRRLVQALDCPLGRDHHTRLFSF